MPFRSDISQCLAHYRAAPVVIRDLPDRPHHVGLALAYVLAPLGCVAALLRAARDDAALAWVIAPSAAPILAMLPWVSRSISAPELWRRVMTAFAVAGWLPPLLVMIVGWSVRA
jgi:hypothetical protein